MVFYPMEKLYQLHDGYRKAFSINGNDLLLMQEAGQVFIIENRCPHMDAPLTHGTVKNGVIKCPLHGIEFELKSGRAVAGNVSPLMTLTPSYENNVIGVLL